MLGLLTYKHIETGSASFGSQAADAVFFKKFHYPFALEAHAIDEQTSSEFSTAARPLLEAGGWGGHLAAIPSQIAPVAAGN